MQEKTGIRNILLTLIALAMVFGVALAVPSGTVLEDPEANYSDEADDEDGDDEFDFLLPSADKDD